MLSLTLVAKKLIPSGISKKMKFFTVKLFAFFRENRFNKKECEYPSGTTVADVVADLDIDIEEVGVLMLNSRHCGPDTEPQDGDVLAIFPVIGGG